MIIMYVLTKLGYVFICQVKEKGKRSSFEIALAEKSESSTRNKNGLVEAGIWKGEGWESRRFVCVLLYFLLKVAAFVVPS